ncbi:rod shape-determining protein MreC [Acidaminobacter sp.]|uniref:rod shape-determining protein MreC n=1 Tax=Acidaminobacter sp. TaxID=1872102 RepID=UPI001383E98C|nr:rod shape-determining protein MreC [Acidaminobacter sp.]MDK9709789.1 rod shape-determining protein MreC [Acidaminobacter sp.]MZQ96855.1 rod shape-determining protein MreC [Acidaminobacter sp.]
MHAYPKWKKIIIIIVSILLLTFMGISAGGRSSVSVVENLVAEVVYPIQKFFYGINQSIGDRIEPIAELYKNARENEALKEEVESLRAQVVSLTLDQRELIELRELKGALRYVETESIQNFVSASVLSKDPGNWYENFVIDAGSEDGVTKNSAVINGSGLVGMVYDVGTNWSKVVTLIDKRSTISFSSVGIIAPYDGQIIGSADHILRGQIFDPTAKMSPGDLLVTSGLGIFPKGIVIGEIKELIDNRDALLPEVVVEPFVDFQSIKKVMVIPSVTVDTEAESE